MINGSNSATSKTNIWSVCFEFSFKFAHLVNKENTENALPISHPMSPPNPMMFDNEHLGSTESENFACKSDIFTKFLLQRYLDFKDLHTGKCSGSIQNLHKLRWFFPL